MERRARRVDIRVIEPAYVLGQYISRLLEGNCRGAYAQLSFEDRDAVTLNDFASRWDFRFNSRTVKDVKLHLVPELTRQDERWFDAKFELGKTRQSDRYQLIHQDGLWRINLGFAEGEPM